MTRGMWAAAAVGLHRPPREKYNPAMAEPAHTARTSPLSELRDAEQAPVHAADFPGCRAIRIAPEDIEDHEGRVEYWEARTATAMVVCEPTTTHHERPGHRLAGLAERLAASRGSPIAAFGTADLVRFDMRGKPRVLMQADQILYLHPPSAEELAPKVDVDGGEPARCGPGGRLLDGCPGGQAAALRCVGFPRGLGRRAGRGLAESPEVATPGLDHPHARKWPLRLGGEQPGVFRAGRRKRSTQR